MWIIINTENFVGLRPSKWTVILTRGLAPKSPQYNSQLSTTKCDPNPIIPHNTMSILAMLYCLPSYHFISSSALLYLPLSCYIFLCPFISKFLLCSLYAVDLNYIRFEFCRCQILQLPQAVIMISKCYFPILIPSLAFFICFHNKFLKLPRDFVIILRFVV